MSTITTTEHPHIVRVDDVCGSRPVVSGTRTSVRTIVGCYKLGMSVEDIMEGLPHLTAAQVYDALSYYHDNQEEIEKDIRENRLQSVMEKYGLRKDEHGSLVPNDIGG